MFEYSEGLIKLGPNSGGDRNGNGGEGQKHEKERRGGERKEWEEIERERESSVRVSRDFRLQ